MIQNISASFKRISDAIHQIIPNFIEDYHLDDPRAVRIISMMGPEVHHMLLAIKDAEATMIKKAVELDFPPALNAEPTPIGTTQSGSLEPRGTCLGGFTPRENLGEVPTAVFEMPEPDTSDIDGMLQNIEANPILDQEPPLEESPPIEEAPKEKPLLKPSQRSKTRNVTRIPRAMRMTERELDHLDMQEQLPIADAVRLAFNRKVTPKTVIISLPDRKVPVQGKSVKDFLEGSVKALISSNHEDAMALAKSKSFPSFYLEPKMVKDCEVCHEGICFLTNLSFAVALRRIEIISEKLSIKPGHMVIMDPPCLKGKEAFVVNGNHNRLLSLEGIGTSIKGVRVNKQHAEASSIKDAYYEFIMACMQETSAIAMANMSHLDLRSKANPDRMLFSHESGVLPHEDSAFNGLYYNAVPDLAALKEFMKVVSTELGLEAELIID